MFLLGRSHGTAERGHLPRAAHGAIKTKLHYSHLNGTVTNTSADTRRGKKLHKFPKLKKTKQNTSIIFIWLMQKNTLVVDLTKPPVFLCERAYDSTVAD